MASRDGRWLILRTAPVDRRQLPTSSASRRATRRWCRWWPRPRRELYPGALARTAAGWPTPRTNPGRPRSTSGRSRRPPSAKWQVSTAGGAEPAWSSTGRELFYINGKSDMVSAEIPAGATFSVGKQRILFSISQFAGRAGPLVLPDARRQAVPRAARGRGRAAGRAGRGGELGGAAHGAGGEMRAG